MADTTWQAPPEMTAQLERLREVASGRQQGLVLTHDNPDPDAMASAWGMAYLFENLCSVPTRLAYGGIIGRAENRELVRILKVPMISLGRLSFEDFDLTALVDTQPAAGNHSHPRDRLPDVVVDHHPKRLGSDQVPLAVVAQGYGATSSIITELIRAAGLEPPPQLATALFYGVKSDTRSLGRESIPADAEAYAWLFPRSDQTLLTQIEHPQVPVSYFRAYHTAYERARLFGNVVLVDLGDVYMPDIVPEIAERLLSLEGAKWSVAIGSYEDDLYVSVRTKDRRMNAGKQIQTLTHDLGGSAGGHGSMAGAKIPLHGLEPTAAAARRTEVLERFRRAMGVEQAEGGTIV